MELSVSEVPEVHSDGSSGKHGAAAAAIVLLPRCAKKIKVVGYLGDVDSLSAEKWGQLMGLLIVRLWSRKSGLEVQAIDCFSDSQVLLERFRAQSVEAHESVNMCELLTGWDVALHKVRGHAKRATTQPERFNAACDRACSWLLPRYEKSKQSGQILSRGPIITLASRSAENSWYFVDMQEAVAETRGYGIAEGLLAGVFEGMYNKVGGL